MTVVSIYSIIIFKRMKGIIIINPFLIPEESVKQAERLKQEFNKKGVDVDIITDGYLKSNVCGGNITTELSADFAVYLDKDKYLSEMLEKSGLRLFNSHNAIRICDDKARTYIALSDKGFNMPRTIFGALCYSERCEIDNNAVKNIAEKLNFPVIVKECYGSMGKGVYKADNLSELKVIMEKVKTRPHLFQEYIGIKKGVDVRLIVIGGKVVASMERRNSEDFRSNVARGGEGVKVEVPSEFMITAERIAKELKLDYCGVDLLYGKDNQPIVCEVNSNAFFEGIEIATGVNVAEKYVQHIINCVE